MPLRASNSCTASEGITLGGRVHSSDFDPIFKLVHAGQTFTSGPQFGGDPDSARSGNAKALCKTETGAACRVTDGTLRQRTRT